MKTRQAEPPSAEHGSHLTSADGLFANAIATRVRDDTTIIRVDQLADTCAVSTRHLQRLVRHHLGLTPKWLIQRRRLHEAATALKTGVDDLAALAAELGHTDQAHFDADWKRVTRMTPGAYRDDQ